MKPKKKAALKLSKETLRMLTVSELGGAAGGRSHGVNTYTTCQSGSGHCNTGYSVCYC